MHFSSGVSASWTTNTCRLVSCQSCQKSPALSQGKSIRVAHTPSLPERMAAALDAFGIINKRFEEIAAAFKGMVEVNVNHERLAHYVDRVFPLPADRSDGHAVARVQNARNESARLFDSSRGNTAPKVGLGLCKTIVP